MQHSLHGLYAITDSTIIPPTRFVETVEQAIIGGARIIQYRDKSENHFLRLKLVQDLRQLCRQYHIPLIINDNMALAQSIGADGIHLGKHDTNVATARAVLGKDIIIGSSCYNQLSLAQQAVANGATYVAFGSFFASTLKPEAVRASLDLLREARQILTCPIVAIGGITPDNGADLVVAGADCLAVIQGLFGQSDVTAAAQRYAQLWYHGN
jgi:thiamine-phosphate pyrophosphorylase